MHNDRDLCLAGDTGIIPWASHLNPEGVRHDGPDEHPYTPDALLSEPNCPSSHSAREARVLPLAALRDEKRHVALACEPLEAGGMGIAKRINQSLYIAPAARTQYTFKI
jgi:hypothetical protein